MSKIILDFCGNHLGDREILDEMLSQAASIGPDFIKFQAYRTGNLNVEWADRYEYYESRELDDDDYVHILEKCKEYNLTPMFTAFHIEMLDILYKFNVEYVKIGSAEANRMELVDAATEMFRDVFISCGMLDNREFWNLFDLISKKKNKEHIKLFYCVSHYPTRFEDVDFDIMKMYQGFSDHTPDLCASKKAVNLGVEFIERHFTLGKFLPGSDHRFSSTPDEAKELIDYAVHFEKIKKYKTRFL